MNPIRTNKPVFFGNDGEVLKSGMIYIGQPNQWPISFPKTVTFQDSAGSQFTAQQPMRTNGQGQIEYNGKAIIALVDGNYSMLVRDRNGVNVNDGYTPFIENAAAEADPSSVTQVGLLLSDIKQFDVTPGETVRNVGKLTTLDELGEDWLVVSNTGGPADDETLIDFANGTQGKVLRNKPDYQEEIIELGGDFTAGEQVKVARSGSQVIISSPSGVLAHASGFQPTSSVGAIPTWARPSVSNATDGIVVNFYGVTAGPTNCFVAVYDDGSFQTVYRDTAFSSGVGANRTNTAFSPTVSYNV